MVTDQALSLPPNAAREYHGQRPVIVISGDAKNASPEWPHVLVVPTSSSGRRSTEYCVKLAYSTANTTNMLAYMGLLD
jgi:mRNA-degrading endonuclease toxin of MazEF toxin-antitoxin module